MANPIEVPTSPCTFSNIVTDFKHCKLTGDIEYFYTNTVDSQMMNNSPQIINNGGSYYGYVPEAVQQEVDGVYTPEDINLEDILCKLTPQLDESLLLPTLNFELKDYTIDNNSTDSLIGNFKDIVDPQGDVDPSPKSLPAESSPIDFPCVSKHKPSEGREDNLPPKKKCLYQQAPFDDKIKEKKRRDAIRAKRNRDNKKDLLSRLNEERTARQKLEQEVAHLKKQVEDMQGFIKTLQFSNVRNLQL